MPKVTRVPPSGSVPFELVTLADESANSSVTVAPARGALVTSFLVGSRELLYLDATTLVDATKNVRGGVPVLFPSPGKLEGGAFTVNGRSYGMKQHGFARNLPWEVREVRDDAPAVVLGLSSSDETLAQYPFDFALSFTFSLRGRCLRIDQRVENQSAEPMPFGLGFHPYFLVRDKAAARVETRATRAFDNVTKTEKPFAGFDFSAGEVDLHLVDHGSAASALDLGDGARIEVRGTEEFWRWVIWTLPGKDFVCLEPWTAAGDALNTGERILRLSPGAVHDAFVEIALSDSP